MEKSLNELLNGLIEENYINENRELSDMGLIDIKKDISETVGKGVDYLKDGYSASKILDYYQMALRVKNIYNDKKLFEYLKIESKKEYKSIVNEKIQKFVKDEVKDFLK